MSGDYIHIEGARQNNLKGISLDIPLNELIVVTGVSGSGKSSLAFDTIYAEGQRRYVETFSPYARQFLERMDRPQVDRIEGIPPAIAIDQTNPVRTSRSTVGTMTELNDHIKLLFARAARLYCRGCDAPVRRDTADSIVEAFFAGLDTSDRDTDAGRRADAPLPRAAATCPSLEGERPREPVPPPRNVLITFPVTVPPNFSEQEVLDLLEKQGYKRVLRRNGRDLDVVQSRVRVVPERRTRIAEDIETALRRGQGRIGVTPLAADGPEGAPLLFSTDLHCPACDIHYTDTVPNLFSFNSPIGACDTCRGFGRVIGVDYGLVVPDETRSLAQGAVKPWQTKSYSECQENLLDFAGRRGIPIDVPWRELTEDQRQWVLEGEGRWEDGLWYGAKRFFEWLETKAYRMHIRVLLSRYRAYHTCPACHGSRLKPDALLWRVGPGRGLDIKQVMLLPIDQCFLFFRQLQETGAMDEAGDLLLSEIRTRLGYLVDVGLGYLTLDRQSRTLSGGEVQRINLTTALGTSLVNALFVLDEPSIGLHARDIRRLVGVLHRLRDAGNTLIVVEHDPDVIRAADRVLDMGPGPGEQGGDIVFFGPLDQIGACGHSLTGAYLAGRKAVTGQDTPRLPVPPGHPQLEILGASEHNLKGIDVRFPLNRLVCLTGVSGSGKSTLLQDVCYNALRRAKGKAADAPGRHRELRGHEQIADVVLVDQSPIGKTTRSNPATYVGALDPIRQIFARAPLARARGYTAGTFSFNSNNGRCPECSGTGFQHVEMQFLSDVYLRCPECDGRRYRDEVLEVEIHGGKSIADVLDMTVAEACALFADNTKVLRALLPLRQVGLGYTRLGQPVPTLSGGEAQRLKLAGHLAGTTGTADAPTLFLFDEPTTGLHFEDVATLLTAMRQLVGRGHSAVVIEHNLDVIRAADWVTDLGPEGGDAGGEVLCVGTPSDIARCARSHTGAALRDAGMPQTVDLSGKRERPPSRTPDVDASNAIRIHNAREHNLKGIDVRIPRDTLTVITGISGSGKSTVAFDILFGEGQRRYLESLNAYARQFVQPASRPDVDAVFGVPPTVAIEQRSSRGGRKSTVGTVTEIYHFLRLLFVKLGTQHCPECDVPIEPQTRDAILNRVFRAYRGRKIDVLAPLVTARKGYYTDLAKWAAKRGFDHLRVDGAPLPTHEWPRLDRFKEHDIELPLGSVDVHPSHEAEVREAVDAALEYGGGTIRVLTKGRGRRQGTLFSTRRACPGCGRSFPEPDPRLFSYNSKHGWCPQCYGTGLLLHGFGEDQTGEEKRWNAWYGGNAGTCPTCEGKRLRPEALAVRFRDYSIADLAALSVAEAEATFASLPLEGAEAEIGRDILAEIRSRLYFLSDVGLPYLSLDRAAPTLSGGEAQRIRLASQLGSNLRGVCYILDEPTIGLHPHDNLKLLEALTRLRDKGNTVVVVEHDETTIRHAEHIIDLGPGAGVAGGRLVAEGTVEDISRNRSSVTGRLLRNPLRHPLVTRRAGARHGRGRGFAENALRIVGAHLHNLRDVSVAVPLGRLVCVTGVSGSGKSTLVRDLLHDNVRALLRHTPKKDKGSTPDLRGCRGITGVDRLGRTLEVDQTPIGRTPRSCPATYVGFWSAVRRLFAATPEARMRAFGPARFSFNVQGGRCETCQGQGRKKIEMSFLPDVSVACEACGGARFNSETLGIRYRDRTVADVLGMSVSEAAELFSPHTPIHTPLRLLEDVGLGYLTLGQQSPTLSGGEAQRIKLVTELAKAPLGQPFPPDTGNTRKARHTGCHGPTLYVLDEPTVGLHMADVEKLIRVLHRLVDAGHTVVVIEHNLDVIAEADWIIDLGPEGGDQGGAVVAQGTPSQVARATRRSHTGRILADFLRDRGKR